MEEINSDKSMSACVYWGLIVNAEAPWIGASSDYLLYDSEETTPFEKGEVKCPFSMKEMTINVACEDSSFFKCA